MKYYTLFSILFFFSIFLNAQTSEINNSSEKTTYSVTFNADIEGAINSGSFVIGADQLWVGGTMNDWTIPGVDPLYEMTESQYEGVYTTTEELENGDYEYKYFMIHHGIPSWEYGEWPGSQNRTFTVNNDNIILNDIVWPDPWGEVEGNDKEFVEIYPNPSKGIFIVETCRQAVSFQINDITGKPVYNSRSSNHNTIIDISDHAPGIYFLSLFTEKRSITKKVIIQN